MCIKNDYMGPAKNNNRETLQFVKRNNIELVKNNITNLAKSNNINKPNKYDNISKASKKQ